jgi:hypothetical protein
MVLLLLATPLAAQLSDKEATAQYKSESKTLLKDFKAASTDLKATVIDAIEVFEDGLPDAADPFASANTLAEALKDYHSSVRELLLEVSLASNAFWMQALSDFANGVPLNGIYPEGLVSGDGGPVDDLRQAVDKHLAKLATSINKRLDKAEKAAEKDGFGLLAWSGPPQGMVPGESSEALSVSAFPPLSIDVLLSLSALDTAADGRLWVGGSSNSAKVPVSLTVTQGLDTVDSAGVPVSTTQTWLFELDGEGTGLVEGNLLVFADLDDAGAIESSAFGIR